MSIGKLWDLALVALLLAVVGCAATVVNRASAAAGDGNGRTYGTNQAADQGSGPGAMMGDIDRHFVEVMIPHHQQAIAMARLALERAQRQELKDLASSIVATQTAEIEQLRSWYSEWHGADVPERTRGRGMMGEPGGTAYCSHGAGVASISEAADFDRAFITTMIRHHVMAVMMAQMVLAQGSQSQLTDVAQAIVASRNAEVEQLRGWYEEWYGSDVAADPARAMVGRRE